MIPIDSIFSPVRRVSYDVEAARVGQRTDYDKLNLDVTTVDRSTRARRSARRPRSSSASSRSSDIDRIGGFSEEPAERSRSWPSRSHTGWRTSRSRTKLGVRSYNFLKRVGIETIGDLVMKSENELGAIPNVGKKSIEEVKETLATHGLNLRGDEKRADAPFSGKKLGQDASHRKALYSNLAGL